MFDITEMFFTSSLWTHTYTLLDWLISDEADVLLLLKTSPVNDTLITDKILNDETILFISRNRIVSFHD